MPTREPTKAMIAAELADTKMRLEAVERQNALFRRQVSSVATRYAREHGFCDEIDNALDELSLKRTEYRYTVTATVETYFDLVISDDAMRQAMNTDGTISPALERDAIQTVLGGTLCIDRFELISDDEGIAESPDNFEFPEDVIQLVRYKRVED